MNTIREESDRILKLFENGHVPQGRVHEAQESFRALKNKLQAEYKRMATDRAAIPQWHPSAIRGNIFYSTILRSWNTCAEWIPWLQS
jgi:hypothetical protein